MASRAIAFPWPTATLRSSRDDCPRSHTNLLGWLICMLRPSCTFVCRRGSYLVSNPAGNRADHPRCQPSSAIKPD